MALDANTGGNNNCSYAGYHCKCIILYINVRRAISDIFICQYNQQKEHKLQKTLSCTPTWDFFEVPSTIIIC